MGNSIKAVISRSANYEAVDKGLLFRQGHKYDMESAEVAYMLIHPGILYPHMLLTAVADGDVEIEFLFAPTVDTYGAEEPSGNFNFNSLKTSVTTWFIAPTLTTEGTHAATTWVLGGSGLGTPSSAKSSAVMADFDVVLIPNVDFLIKFTNRAGRDVQLMFETVYRERRYDRGND